MIPNIDNPAATMYRRMLSRLAISYIGMLYTMQGYTYTALKAMAQRCLDILKNIELRCNAKYYRRIFAKYQEMAKVLRVWHAKKICVAGLRQHMSRNQVEVDFRRTEEGSGDELEETRELLNRHRI